MLKLENVRKTYGSLVAVDDLSFTVKDGEIYEDYAITSESERLIHFGQEDHVRIYSVDGLKKRLESVGFSIIVKQYEKDEYLGFSNEIMLVATK